ncbi:MAG: class I SAM-dependent methyltransferase [Nitrospirota bacterium]
MTTPSDEFGNETIIMDCLAGRKLYGDDFSTEEIAKWFADEEEGFANLGAKNRESYCYEYHGLNRLHGFNHLQTRNYSHALSIGGAYGEELRPFLPNINAITILEPSGAFTVKSLDGVPVHYVKPLASGVMPFDNDTFDIATCFGCLHHIPNVSMVLRELYRCLKPNGVALVREPIISMGDWRQVRRGLTKRERGIPLFVFRQILSHAGFIIVKETLCGFPLTPRLGSLLKGHVYNSSIAVRVDQFLAYLFAWNYRYHATRPYEKLMPTVAAYIICKTSVDPKPYISVANAILEK